MIGCKSPWSSSSFFEGRLIVLRETWLIYILCLRIINKCSHTWQLVTWRTNIAQQTDPVEFGTAALPYWFQILPPGQPVGATCICCKFGQTRCFLFSQTVLCTFFCPRGNLAFSSFSFRIMSPITFSWKTFGGASDVSGLSFTLLYSKLFKVRKLMRSRRAINFGRKCWHNLQRTLKVCPKCTDILSTLDGKDLF